MNTNTNIIIALLILIIGFGAGYTIRGNDAPKTGGHMMADGSVMQNGGMGGAMDNMMEGLQGKTGDAFDQAFLSEMIMHHEGAVQMAEAALQYAKHQEIKDMAKAIISAQTIEIEQMKVWGKSWYTQ